MKIRVEAEADDRLAVLHHVGEDRHHARRHGREVDISIGDFRRDRHDDVADGGDAHGTLLWNWPVPLNPERHRCQRLLSQLSPQRMPASHMR